MVVALWSPVKFFKTCAMSEADAFLIGMTTGTYSFMTAASIFPSESSIRLTFSSLSRKTRSRPSIAAMLVGDWAKGCSAEVTSFASTFVSSTTFVM